MMIRKIFLLLSLSLIFVTSSFSADIEAVIGKVSNGYNYWFYTPKSVSASADSISSPKPLIVFLHGASLCGTNLDKVKRYGTINAIEKGREIDAYVVAPQNPGGSWKPEKVLNIVDYVSANYDVDPNRVYVLGMSLGGYGAIDFAATYPDRIAAAIGMCGGSSVKNLDGLADLPLWIIHGTADSAVSVSQSDKVVKAVKDAQSDNINRLSYDRVPGMNHSQPARVFYNPETYEWLLSHRLDDPDRPMTVTPSLDASFLQNAYSGLNHSKGYKGTSTTRKKAKTAVTKKKKRSVKKRS